MNHNHPLLESSTLPNRLQLIALDRMGSPFLFISQ